ncbi:Hypothetical predicted protein [Podarcis lilfordi]|uniref:Uncharacterized protein n=1 Tax=Podarcis lilfordi TaxID=74358 RepID=A0AA35PFW0_9SAUR|nr:Hypothetical predicted protein [Podarcis lilfordi]
MQQQPPLHPGPSAARLPHNSALRAGLRSCKAAQIAAHFPSFAAAAPKRRAARQRSGCRGECAKGTLRRPTTTQKNQTHLPWKASNQPPSPPVHTRKAKQQQPFPGSNVPAGSRSPTGWISHHHYRHLQEMPILSFFL